MMKRILAGTVGAVAILAGWIAAHYAVMAWEDFLNPEVGFWLAIFGNVISWAFTLTPVVFGVRFLKFAFRNRGADSGNQPA